MSRLRYSMSKLIRSLVLSVLVIPNHAQQTNFFINPPRAGEAGFFLDNPIFAIGETIEIRWTTDIDLYSIGLWQQSLGVGVATAGPNIYSKIPGGPEEGALNWTVETLGFSLRQSNVFYLNLSDVADDNDNVVTCHYFNLTDAAASTTSSTATSSDIGTSASPSTSASSILTEPTVSTSRSSDSDAPDNGKPTKVGIGVGLGLGIPLLAILAYLGFRYHKRRRRNNVTEYTIAPQDSQISPAYRGSGSVKELPTTPYKLRNTGSERQRKSHIGQNEPVELDAE